MAAPPVTPPTVPGIDPAVLTAIQTASKEYEKQVESIKQIVSSREKLIKQLEAEEQKAKEIERINQSIEIQAKIAGDYQNKKNILLQAQLDLEVQLEKKEADRDQAEIKRLKALIDASKTTIKGIEDKIKLEQDGVKKQMEIEEKLHKAREEDIKKQGEAFKKLGELASKVGNALLEGFNFPLLGVKIKGFREIMTDIIKAPAEAFKKYGFLDQYTQSIDNMRQGMIGFGVDEKSMYEALGELNQVVADFPNYSKSLQEQLVGTSAKLALAGFNSKATTLAFNNMTKMFNLTAPAADGARIKLAALSKTLGDGTKTFDDFNAMAPKLASFGGKAIEIFENTAIAAKKLGMDSKELFDIMHQADTFDKAADAAGNLNAMLGGQFFDSLELMKLSLRGSTEDILRYYQDAFKKGGVEVNKLEREQILALSSAAKMSEEQFTKIFGAGGQGVDEYLKKQKEATEKQNHLNEIAKKTQDVFQDIQNAFAKAFADKNNINSLVKVVMNIKDMALFFAKILQTIKNLAPIMAGLFAASQVLSFAAAIRTANGVMAALRATTLGQAIAQAFATGLTGAGLVAVGLSLAAAGGAAAYMYSLTGDDSGTSSLNAISSGTGGGSTPETPSIVNPSEIGSAPASPIDNKTDDVSYGGGMIIPPKGSGQRARRLASDDTTISARPGGILDQKLDTIISLMKEYGGRPTVIELDGQRVNKQLGEAARIDPFKA